MKYFEEKYQLGMRIVFHKSSLHKKNFVRVFVINIFGCKMNKLWKIIRSVIVQKISMLCLTLLRLSHDVAIKLSGEIKC